MEADLSRRSSGPEPAGRKSFTRKAESSYPPSAGEARALLYQFPRRLWTKRPPVSIPRGACSRARELAHCASGRWSRACRRRCGWV